MAHMPWFLWLVLGMVHLGHSQMLSQCPNATLASCFYSDVATVNPSTTNQFQFFTVGAMFDVRQGSDNNAYTCGNVYSDAGILHTQAFLWSLKYFQQQLNSRVSIGGVVFDSCMRNEQNIQNLLGFEQCNIRVQNVDRYNLMAFVGPLTNTAAMSAASLGKNLQLPMISPTANTKVLSDTSRYPYFLRTTPSITNDIEILYLVLNQVIQTPYVSAIYEQSMMETFQLFRDRLQSGSICLSASLSMNGSESDNDLTNIVNPTSGFLYQQLSIRYVALFLSPTLAVRFMNRVSLLPEIRDRIIFLMTSDMSINSILFTGTYSSAANNSIVLERANAMNQASFVAFQNYWNQLKQSNPDPSINNPWFADYNRTHATLPPYSVDAAFTIMATEAIIRGVLAATPKKCSGPTYLCTDFLGDADRGSNIYTSIRSATNYFDSGTAGQLYLNNDLAANFIYYRVHQFRRGSIEQFAYYTSSVLTPTRSLKDTSGNYYSIGSCTDPSICSCYVPVTVPSTTGPASQASTTPSSCPSLSDGNYSWVQYPLNQEITGAYTSQPRSDSTYTTRFDLGGQRWILALGVLAGFGILCVIVFEIYIMQKLLGTRLAHTWRTMWLGQLLLFGIFLCYLTIFAYLPVPTKATCGITRFGVGVSYSICFAVLLVKLMVILTSKSSETLLPGDIESPNYLKGIYQFLMFVFAVGVQIVIDVQWLITVPPEAVKVVSNNGEEVWICNHYTWHASGSEKNDMLNMPSFVRTEFENHVMSLIYIMFLILITTLLALNAHGIITNHRESIFIGIASGFSIPVWLAWTLVGGLNRSHAYAQEFGDACVAIGLFVTATLILFSMFLPKVRQLVNMGVEGIYFEDDRETYYAGSVIMAPPSYKSRPNSVIYVNNQGIYSEPIVIGNGDPNTATLLRHPGSHIGHGSVYSAPPTLYKKADSSFGTGSRVLQVTNDLSGRRPLEKKRALSEVAYGTPRPRSHKGTLPRSRSQSSLGAL